MANDYDCNVVRIEDECCNETSVVDFQPNPLLNTDPLAMHVKEYLERPVLLARGNYNAAVRASVYQTPIDRATLSAIFPWDFVTRATGIRFTIKFRVQFTANPFMAGIVKLVWQPMDSAFYSNRATSTCFASQLPGTYVDISEQTEGVLEIPWTHVYDYMGTTSTYPDFTLGFFNLVAYTPVAVGAGADTPNYVIWVSLHDIQLVGANPKNLINVIPQLNPMFVEAKNSGLISKTLNTVSGITATISNAFPLLSPYFGPTSWFLRAASLSAAAFGWSRPMNVDKISRMAPTTTNYWPNCDAPDTSTSLGLFSDTGVAILPGFASSKYDEMELKYVLGRYSAICYSTLSVADVPDTYCYACVLTPSAMFFRANFPCNVPVASCVPSVSGKAIQPAPVCYFGNQFSLWRGGFKFRIKFAKTKFHTGRLLVGFYPTSNAFDNENSMNLPVPTDPISYKTLLFDMRQSNMLEFECPYVAHTPYRDIATTAGVFFVRVLSPIEAPSTVSNIVPFVVEVACTDDFEFHAPVSSTLGLKPGTAAPFSTYTQADTTFKHDGSQQSMFAIGEKMLSLKQWISRASITTAQPVASTAVGAFTVLPPNQWTNPVQTSLVAMTSYNLTPCSYMARCYAFSRGSYNVSYAGGEGVSWTSLLTRFPLYRTLSGNAVNIEGLASNHIKVPYYSKVSRSTCHPASTALSVNIALNVSSLGYAHSNVTPSPLPTKQPVLLRAGDDYQFGYFLSTWPLVYTNDMPAIDDTETSTVDFVNFLQDTAPP